MTEWSMIIRWTLPQISCALHVTAHVVSSTACSVVSCPGKRVHALATSAYTSLFSAPMPTGKLPPSPFQLKNKLVNAVIAVSELGMEPQSEHDDKSRYLSWARFHANPSVKSRLRPRFASWGHTEAGYDTNDSKAIAVALSAQQRLRTAVGGGRQSRSEWCHPGCRSCQGLETSGL